MKSSVSDFLLPRGAAPLCDASDLMQLRKELLRFAILQLRNRELAEDVVQEVLVSACTANARFEHRAALRSWLFAVMKNKIIDVFRDRWNKDRVDLIETDDESEFDVVFTHYERWQRDEMPTSWGNPEQSFENLEFWHVFDLCMSKLPEATARVFSMREFLGLDATEICRELKIKPSNCWIILYRARMYLRLCLQQHWFTKDEQK